MNRENNYFRYLSKNNPNKLKDIGKKGAINNKMPYFKYLKETNPVKFMEISRKNYVLHPEKVIYAASLGGKASSINAKQRGLKISLALRGNPKCIECGKKGYWAIRKRIDSGEHKIFLKKWAKEHPEHYKKINILSLRTRSKKGFMSKQELIMKQLLPDDFIYGQELGNVGIPDFFSIERKIVVEVDGEYWHNQPKQIIRDNSRNEYWKKLGYKVFRVPCNDIKEFLEPLLENKI
jgi:very-short-patch-repair endonuclease